MSTAENPIGGEIAKSMVTEKIVRGLHSLANSPMKETSANAQVLFDFIFNQTKDMDGGTLPSPTMMSDLILFPMTGLPGKNGCVFASSYKPMIKLNTDNLLTGTDQEIEADLVRTSYVARQLFTKEGFSPRLRIVYGRAIRQQLDWLEQNQIPPIPDDPRTTPREKLLRKVLGEQRYLGDTGYRDWQRTIDIWVGSTDPQNVRDTLMNEVEKAREADQQTPSAEYSEEALQTTLQAFGDAIAKASTDTAIHGALESVRDNQQHFLFIREDVNNDRSMRSKLRKPILSSILGNKNLGPNIRALIMAHVYAHVTVNEFLEDKN